MKKNQSHIAPVYILFLFSGATGLAYQVVWIRMLVRTFGATSFAISTVLAAYMGHTHYRSTSNYLKFIDAKQRQGLAYFVASHQQPL